MGSPSDAKDHDQTSTGASSTLTSSGNDRVHRYDPGAMGRVADITDALIKDGSSDSDSDIDSDDDAIVIGRRSTLEFDEPDIENRRRNNSQHLMIIRWKQPTRLPCSMKGTVPTTRIVAHNLPEKEH